MNANIILMEVSNVDREVADNIFGREYPNYESMVDTADLKEYGSFITSYTLSEFATMGNNQDINLNDYWMGYVYFTE